MANHPPHGDSTGTDKQDDKQRFPQNRGSGFGAGPQDHKGSGKPGGGAGQEEEQRRAGKGGAKGRKDEDDRGGNTAWTPDGSSTPGA